MIWVAFLWQSCIEKLVAGLSVVQGEQPSLKASTHHFSSSDVRLRRCYESLRFDPRTAASSKIVKRPEGKVRQQQVASPLVSRLLLHSWNGSLRYLAQCRRALLWDQNTCDKEFTKATGIPSTFQGSWTQRPKGSTLVLRGTHWSCAATGRLATTVPKQNYT